MRKILSAFFIVISGICYADPALKFAMATPKGSSESEMSEKLVSEIFRRSGFNVEFGYFPVERCRKLLLSGEYDGLPGKPKDELDFFSGCHVVEEPFLLVPFKVYSKNKIIKNPTWGALEKYKCVNIIGVKLVQKRMKGAMASGNLSNVATYEQALKMILAERVDFAILAEHIADGIIKQNGYHKIVKNNSAVETTIIHIFMSSKNSDAAKKASAALKQMKADGSYNRILDQFR